MSNRICVLALFTAASAGACLSPSTSDIEDVSAAQCAAATAWTAWTAYATGAVVTYDGTTYVCVQGHTSEPGWTPDAVAALWSPASCAGGSGGGGGGGGGGGATCDASAWVYMATDASACDGHVGESCGWTSTNENQGYHCATTSWGTGCEPGGETCPNGSGSGGSSGSGSGSGSSGSGAVGTAPAGLIFSAYKDTSINMNWNTNVISTSVSGSATPIATDLAANGGKTITLAFATGECGGENWGGVAGAAMATANVPLLTAKNVNYILSTGGAAGSFTCGSDAGFAAFLSRWSSANLIGVDFDIEAGQSQAVIGALVQRIAVAHAAYPGLRFSLTLATLANNNGASTATSLGAGVADSFNVYGDWTLAAVESTLGFTGAAATWPSYVTVNLMTMDYGSPSAGVCVVSGNLCDMGQSAIQAAYNLHDKYGVPYSNIELTPMIGGNDAQDEHFTTASTDVMTAFAITQRLAGVHYWSYDRDTDCPAGSASPTCNSLGGVGAHGFLKRFLADGLH